MKSLWQRREIVILFSIAALFMLVWLAARIIRMERNMLLMRLQRSGIQTVNWEGNIPIDRVLESRLGRQPAWHKATAR
ncbi:MAG: hypothetical protein HQ525_08920 [Anaerolineae bacterium]|nr:hypothetical protein [Anaerolineae bacterium]